MEKGYPNNADAMQMLMKHKKDEIIQSLAESSATKTLAVDQALAFLLAFFASSGASQISVQASSKTVFFGPICPS